MNKKVLCIGREFEKKWNKKTKSQGTIGSGNLWWDKEDGKNPNWLFQNKATKKSHYNLKLIDIQKLKINAEKTSRNWGFVVCFNV